MKKLLVILASILLVVVVQGQPEIESLDEFLDDDPFVDLDTPPVLQDPRKRVPRKVDPVKSVDQYCLCKCIKRGESLAKAKFFKGRTSGKGCICECAVK
jgi:hypothetical protein